MTKVRSPLTVEEALDRVIGQLTMRGAVAATGRTEHYLRALSDPDQRATLSVVDMIKLDVAHMAAGLPGMPIFETVAMILNAAQPEFFSDAFELSRLTIDVVREDGDAHVALIEASLPGADDKMIAKAIQENVESLATRGQVLAKLRSMLPAAKDQPP